MYRNNNRVVKGKKGDFDENPFFSVSGNSGFMNHPVDGAFYCIMTSDLILKIWPVEDSPFTYFLRMKIPPFKLHTEIIISQSYVQKSFTETSAKGRF